MLNLSRPYARRIYSRQIAKKSISQSESSSNGSSSEYDSVFKQVDKSKYNQNELTIESLKTSLKPGKAKN
jgi:hypothetical protein